VGADKMSAIVDYSDRTTCILFGDGAGAVLLEPNSQGLGVKDFILKHENVFVLDKKITAQLLGEEFLDSKFGGMEFLNLRHTTIESVVNSTQWQTEWDKVFRDNSVYVCTRACGKFTEDVISQCRDQFLDVQNFIG
jgi:hypothetical protein